MDEKKSRPKKFLLSIFRVLLTVYLVMCAGLWLLQDHMVFVPKAGAYTRTPADLGFDYQALSLETGGEKIHAWYVPAEKAVGTVLFCHGNAGNLSHRLSTVRIWRELGCNIMLFDYRGYGLSSGKPSEEGCYSDAQAAFDWLSKQGIKGSFYIHGRSLGGAVASKLAEAAPCDGLILESTFTSIPDMGAYRFPILPVDWLCLTRFDSLARMKLFTGRLLVLHSPADEIIPFVMGRQLAAAGKGSFIELTGDHNNGFSRTPEYIPALKEFVFD